MNGIKVGRISRKIEATLSIDLGSDIFLYVSDEMLRRMAKKRPERYLLDIEELSKMVSKPDYVQYETGKKREISFVREYWTKESLFKKGIAVFSFAERWELTYFAGLTFAKEKEMAEKGRVVKIE